MAHETRRRGRGQSSADTGLSVPGGGSLSGSQAASSAAHRRAARRQPVGEFWLASSAPLSRQSSDHNPHHPPMLTFHALSKTSSSYLDSLNLPPAPLKTPTAFPTATAPPLSSSSSAEPLEIAMEPDEILRICQSGSEAELRSLLASQGERLFFYPGLDTEDAAPYTPNLAAMIAGRAPHGNELGTTVVCALANPVVRGTAGVRDRVAGIVAERIRSGVEVTKELEEAKDRSAELENMLEEAERRHIKDIERLRGQAEMSRKEDVEKVTRGFEALRADINAFAEERVAVLESRILEMRKEHGAALELAGKEAEKLVLDARKDAEDRLRNAKSESEDRLNAAKMEATERLAKVRQRAEDLQKQLDRTRKEAHDREKEGQKELEKVRKEAHDRERDTNRELDKLRKEVAEKEKEAHREVEKHRKAVDEEKGKHEKAVDELRKKLDAMERDVKAAKAELDKARERVKEVEHELIEAEKKHASATSNHETELERLQRDLQNARKQTEEREHELELQAAEFERKRSLLDKENEVIRADRERGLKDLDAALAREAALAAQRDELEELVPDLKSRLEESMVSVKPAETLDIAVQTEAPNMTLLAELKAIGVMQQLAERNFSPRTAAVALSAAFVALFAIIFALVRSFNVGLSDLQPVGQCRDECA